MLRCWAVWAALVLLLGPAQACTVINNGTSIVSLGGIQTTVNTVYVSCNQNERECDLTVGNHQVKAVCSAPVVNYFTYSAGNVPAEVTLIQYYARVSNDGALSQQSYAAFTQQTLAALNATGQSLGLGSELGRRRLMEAKDKDDDVAPKRSNHGMSKTSRLASRKAGKYIAEPRKRTPQSPTDRNLLWTQQGADASDECGGGFYGYICGFFGNLFGAGAPGNGPDYQADIDALRDGVNNATVRINTLQALYDNFSTSVTIWEGAQAVTNTQQMIQNVAFRDSILANAQAEYDLSKVVANISEGLVALNADVTNKFASTYDYINTGFNALQAEESGFQSNVFAQLSRLFNITTALNSQVTAGFKRTTSLIQDESDQTSDLAGSFQQYIRRDGYRQALSTAFFNAYQQLPDGMSAFVAGPMIFPHNPQDQPELLRVFYDTVQVNFERDRGYNSIVAITMDFYVETNSSIAINSLSLSPNQFVALMSNGNCFRPVVFDAGGHQIPEVPEFADAPVVCRIYAEVTTQECAAANSAFTWLTANATASPAQQTGVLLPSYCGSSVTTTTTVFRTFTAFQTFYYSDICTVDLWGFAPEYQYISQQLVNIAYLQPLPSTCGLALLDTGSDGNVDLFTIMFAGLLRVFGVFQNSVFNTQLLIEGRPPVLGTANALEPLMGTPTVLDADGNIIVNGAATAQDQIRGSFLSVSTETVPMIVAQLNNANPISQTLTVTEQVPTDSTFSAEYSIPLPSSTIHLVSEVGYPLSGAWLGSLETDPYIHDVPTRLMNNDQSILAKGGTFGWLLDEDPDAFTYFGLYDWILQNGPFWDPAIGALSASDFRYVKLYDSEGYPYCGTPYGIPVNESAILDLPYAGGSQNFTYNEFVNPDSFLCTILKQFKVDLFSLGFDYLGREQFGATFEPRVWYSEGSFATWDGVIVQDLGGVNCSQTTLDANSGPDGLLMTLVNTGAVPIKQRVVVSQLPGHNSSSVCSQSTEVDVLVGVPAYVSIHQCPNQLIEVQKLASVGILGNVFAACTNYTPNEIEVVLTNYPGPDPDIEVSVAYATDTVGEALTQIGQAGTTTNFDIISALAVVGRASAATQAKIEEAKAANSNLTVTVEFPHNLTGLPDTLGPLLAAIAADAQAQEAADGRNLNLTQILYAQEVQASAIQYNMSVIQEKQLVVQKQILDILATLAPLNLTVLPGTGSGGNGFSTSFYDFFDSLWHDLTDVFSDFSVQNILAFFYAVLQFLSLVFYVVGFVYCLQCCGCCKCGGGGSGSGGGGGLGGLAPKSTGQIYTEMSPPYRGQLYATIPVNGRPRAADAWDERELTPLSRDSGF